MDHTYRGFWIYRIIDWYLWRKRRDTLPATSLDANHDYSSAQCSRMALDSAGIAAGWKVEYMPEPRRKQLLDFE